MERRTFLKVATHSLGALVGAILGIPAIAYLLDARNRLVPNRDFKTVGRLSDLQVGVPKQAVISATRNDAWTLYPNDVIGRVWLVRKPNDEVEAFTTICPHLGCSVNFETKEQRFICPCHNGTFDLNGERVSIPGQTNPAPRSMDALPLKLVDHPADPKDKIIQVQYQTFKKLEAERIVQT